jgi:MFS family permease
MMTAFTGGAFLVAMALMLGASNFQIGLLAALPTFMNIFQLISIWLVRRYNNRRAISVICSIFARVPLILAGLLPLFFAKQTGINSFIFFLCFYYFFGSVAGPSWNSWMKDFIPENRLGTFFSNRTRQAQILNVIVSLSTALFLDFIKKYYPQYQLNTYACMFIAAGIFGLLGTYFLYKTPEPQSLLSKENIFRLLRRPLKNVNFRNLLIFNSAWVFAINIATPFFTVYMMKTIGLPISYVIGLTIITQLSGIFTVRVWGIFADRYSNKTIIAISAPLYITCIIAWCFVGLYSNMYTNVALIAFINLFTGMATSGINLSLVNIGLKLAPKDDAIVYLSTKNIITAFFSSIAPLIGGYLADFFANRHVDIAVKYDGPRIMKTFQLLSLHQWNFLFIIGALIALIAVQLLSRVKEKGEVEKDKVVRILRSTIKNSIKDYYIIGTLLDWREHVTSTFTRVFKPEREEDKT